MSDLIRPLRQISIRSRIALNDALGPRKSPRHERQQQQR